MKYKIGTKEIIAAIIGGLLYLAVSFGVFTLESGGGWITELLTWVLPAAVIIIVFAVLFGPFTGAISGGGGCMLTGIILCGQIEFSLVVQMVILGCFVGRYSEKIVGKEEGFNKTAAIDFNVIQMAALIICNVLYAPIVTFILNDKSIFRLLQTGINQLVGTGICTMIIGTPLVFVCSKIMSKVENHVFSRVKQSVKSDEKPGQSEASKILDSYKWN